MTQAVFILGSYQTDFAKPCAREGQDIYDIAREAILAVLDARHRQQGHPCHDDAQGLRTTGRARPADPTRWRRSTPQRPR